MDNVALQLFEGETGSQESGKERNQFGDDRGAGKASGSRLQ